MGNVSIKYKPDNYFLNFTYDDLTPLEKATIPTTDKKPPFAYYYIRVVQEDGHIAWSSPILGNHIPLSSLPKTQGKRPLPKPLAKQDEIDFEDEEEDDDFDDFEDEE